MKLCALLLVVAACASRSTPAPDEAPPGTIVVLADTMRIKSGSVGVKSRTDATYILVDVENHSAHERIVALDGMLRDKDGAELGVLSIDELRIPSGKRRTFALVGGGVVPTATSATFRVRGSPRALFPLAVVVKNVEQERSEQWLLAVTVSIENVIDRPVVATLIVAFYDKDGDIVGRPFTILEVLAKKWRPFRFTAPANADHAEVFVGDVLQ